MSSEPPHVFAAAAPPARRMPGAAGCSRRGRSEPGRAETAQERPRNGAHPASARSSTRPRRAFGGRDRRSARGCDRRALTGNVEAPGRDLAAQQRGLRGDPGQHLGGWDRRLTKKALRSPAVHRVRRGYLPGPPNGLTHRVCAICRAGLGPAPDQRAGRPPARTTRARMPRVALRDDACTTGKRPAALRSARAWLQSQ